MIMTNKEADEFILNIGRKELFENKRSYLKAIRVSLINLGYDFNWVEEEFRNKLEAYYNY